MNCIWEKVPILQYPLSDHQAVILHADVTAPDNSVCVIHVIKLYAAIGIIPQIGNRRAASRGIWRNWPCRCI